MLTSLMPIWTADGIETIIIDVAESQHSIFKLIEIVGYQND